MKVAGARSQAGTVPLADGDPLPPEGSRPRARASTLELLYQTHASRLRRMFSRRVGRDEASDLVHDSFARYASSPPTWGDANGPRAHLDAIAENVLKSRARAAFHRSIVVQDSELIEKETIEIIENLEARDILRRVNAAVLRLSPKTREIFLAHRLEGATYAEIARRTGLGVKGVEWHMSKALAAIHRAAKRG